MKDVQEKGNVENAGNESVHENLATEAGHRKAIEVYLGQDQDRLGEGEPHLTMTTATNQTKSKWPQIPLLCRKTSPNLRKRTELQKVDQLAIRITETFVWFSMRNNFLQKK